jgi:hypothetical protein
MMSVGFAKYLQFAFSVRPGIRNTETGAEQTTGEEPNSGDLPLSCESSQEMNMGTKILQRMLAIVVLVGIICGACVICKKAVKQSVPTTHTAQNKLAAVEASHAVALKQSDDQEKQEVEKLLTSGRDGEPQVKYPAIEVLVAGEWVDQSTHFVDYYRQDLIPAVEEQIKQSTDALEIERLQIRRDKMLRLSGSPSAGLAEALNRVSNPNATQRLLAVAVLKDIALNSACPASGGVNIAAQALSEHKSDWDARVAADVSQALIEFNSGCQ